MSIVIKIENLYKEYQLGVFGYGTMREDIHSWWSKFRGNLDPNSMIDQLGKANNSERILALNNINFEIKVGECIGIIGKNGAGKTTLLKILSQISSPSKGKVKIKGRIASLLSVGTGFHPELTGRENIYLNGAILGLTKKDINKRFDEIVDFSGEEKFIDTPVKRYSSGMRVRLAFAVAAHLEPDILLVDEVLAVGDIMFQKKCLGKMGEVADEGRTILFVSHNMAAVNSFCKRGILLDNGKMKFDGKIRQATKNYLNDVENSCSANWEGNIGDSNVRLLRTWISPKNKSQELHTGVDIEVGIEVEILKKIEGLIMGFLLLSEFGNELAYSLYDDHHNSISIVQPGIKKETFIIPANTLAYGTYMIKFDVGIHMYKRIIHDDGKLIFKLENISGIGRNFLVDSKGYRSLFRPEWSKEK